MMKRRASPSCYYGVAFTALLLVYIIVVSAGVVHAADLIDSYNVGHVVNNANSNNKNNEPTDTQQQQQQQHHINDDNDDIEQTKLSLQQKSSEYKTLQSKLSSKLQTLQTVRDNIKYERASLLTSYTQTDKLYTDMDVIGTKVIELVRRHEKVLHRIKEYNLVGIKGVSQKEAIENETSMVKGLNERLEHVREEEMKRRDRYIASAPTMKSGVEEENGTIAEDGEEGDQIVCTEDAHECPDGSWVGRDSMNDCNFYPCEEEGDSSETQEDEDESTSSPYITKNQLSQLLSSENVISTSESTLHTSLSNLATQLMNEQIRTENYTFRKRSKSVPNQYKKQFNTIKSQLKKEEQRSSNNNNNNNVCLSISKSIEIVSTALHEHYHDGVGLDLIVDHANYENGGSVVYELTSLSYVPPPRNDGSSDGGGENENKDRAAYIEMEKQKMYDEQMETMYYQQQHSSTLHNQGADDGQSLSMWNQFNQVLEQFNMYKWYTTFKFGNSRPYLPEDWERVLDTLSDRTTTTGGGSSWDEYTPRGAMDALVPDFLYHALGLNGLGRTVSPEVAISSSGNGGGWTAKPMGQCYPLSMRLEDDPALSLLSRGVMDFDNEEQEEAAPSSLIIGPKYTVRLPYPIHIDAVTLEHRSFPLPKSMLENEDLKGGESAPRWVRVVGYPPCPQQKTIHHHRDDNGEEECGVRGFDITKPIDLGSFEYQRITVTGREDDYGGSSSNNDDDDEEGSDGNDSFSGGKRRRSIQTFAVKGGKWKPSSLLEEDVSEDDDVAQEEEEEYDSLDARQCSDGSCEDEDGDPSYNGLEEETEQESSLPEPGQCAPPKDEDSVPSCGGDVMDTSQDMHERQIVEALSFIIEENWGNSEYTCLYRVRVHGDAV